MSSSPQKVESTQRNKIKRNITQEAQTLEILGKKTLTGITVLNIKEIMNKKIKDFGRTMSQQVGNIYKDIGIIQKKSSRKSGAIHYKS